MGKNLNFKNWGRSISKLFGGGKKNAGPPPNTSKYSSINTTGFTGYPNIPRYNNEAFAYAGIVTAGLIADDVTGIGIADDVLIPVAWGAASGKWLYDNRVLLGKQTLEINRILEKSMKPSGFTYELRVNNTGDYLDVRGNRVHLNSGDVWKYGETTGGINRYSSLQLKAMVPGGVKMFPIFFGNQVEIKVQEKIMIYGYTIMNGSLPPGNRIFR